MGLNLYTFQIWPYNLNTATKMSLLNKIDDGYEYTSYISVKAIVMILDYILSLILFNTLSSVSLQKAF
jgi:hypothetical protein